MWEVRQASKAGLGPRRERALGMAGEEGVPAPAEVGEGGRPRAPGPHLGVQRRDPALPVHQLQGAAHAP